MLKQIKNLNKKTKTAVIVVITTILVIGGTSIALYAQEQNQMEIRRQQVFNAYWGLNAPVTSDYNTDELDQYNKIINQREQAFVVQDAQTLISLQGLFDALDKNVRDRMKKEQEEQKAREEAERKQKEEAEQKAHDEVNNQHNSGTSSYNSNAHSSGASSNSSGGSWTPPWKGGCYERGNCSTNPKPIEGGSW